MSIALDGFEVLRRIGAKGDLFKPVRIDADKAARALVVKCLKAKTVDLDAVRDMASELGDAFLLICEGLKDAELKAVLTRIDKHHPELKTATATWRRQHLLALADGTEAPTSPPPKAAKKAKKAKAEPARLQSEVMDLYRDGGRKKR